MVKTITIDPVTRISGFLEIKVELEGNTIVNANTSGLLFRGFEIMLKGRSPLDAIYFTERICGICSTAHAIASTLALEDALNVKPSLNDKYLRDIMHGFEFLQNHIRQFYLFTVPSYVRLPEIKPLYELEYTDYRIPEKENKRISESYVKSIDISRLAHQGLAILGGKAPHSHGIFVGGVTTRIDAYKLSKIKSILQSIKQFIKESMMEDMNIVASYYSDYFKKGKSYANFMSYGVFNGYSDETMNYINPSVMVSGKKLPFHEEKITENIKHAWYTSETLLEKPKETPEPQIDIYKKDAYTFVKAPRYDGIPMEVGPLARLMLTGEYTRGNSSMDRNVARVLEAEKICQVLEKIIEKVQLESNNQGIYNMPDSALGVGLTDTTRGALGHWVNIENKVIKNYNIITPTVWNMSPKGLDGTPGTGEKSLIGGTIKNIEKPIEVGRIIRSYDPCISCATHLISDNHQMVTVQVLV